MPSKIPAVPIRLPGVEREALKTEAKALKLSEHAYLLAIVRARHKIPQFAAFPVEQMSDSTGQLTPAPRDVLAQAEANAAHLAKPKPRADRSRWNLHLPVGPMDSPPGSRLKGAGKPKR